MADQVGDYSRLDRLLHKLAFSMPFVQRTLAELEDSLFAKKFDSANDRDPIFITSLPRAGTTVLLTALAGLPELASHTYRDMPFVMAPLLWSKMSSSFKKESATKERAHGDGVQIGYDSPEAFEEILWQKFWPKKYHDSHIDLWAETDADVESTEFFRKHFAKIVTLRCQGAKSTGRYISKNNGNIARLDLIPRMFPDAKIVLPIRLPMEHAASLHRQHLNFLEQHKTDEFTKRYMRDIGHLEFGELHRPIMFPGLNEAINDESPMSLNYWLQYWIATFTYVAERRDRLIILPHELACNDSEATMSHLFELLSITNSANLNRVSSRYKSIAPRTHDYANHNAQLREQAEALYESLVINWNGN